MKKFGKFVFGTLSFATLAAGAYFVYKNFIKHDNSDDFDDFEDEFDDFEDEFDDFDDFDSEDEAGEFGETREYVSIQIDQEPTEEESGIDENETDKLPDEA